MYALHDTYSDRRKHALRQARPTSRAEGGAVLSREGHSEQLKEEVDSEECRPDTQFLILKEAILDLGEANRIVNLAERATYLLAYNAMLKAGRAPAIASLEDLKVSQKDLHEAKALDQLKAAFKRFQT